ncbi:MAG: DegT/DnrJ/EryC1/StrS family aminotransferase, partial [Propionibacteriaceae bacterium]|nr:DegT/DnrJ/EryC1/StrS family aminotransferase [Propionibacteriaceae bacterium]
ANMPDVLAAIGLSQLGRYADTLARRHALLDHYSRELLGTGVELMAHSGPGFRSSAHLAIASLPVAGEAERNRIIQDLFLAGVSANVHYKPLPLLRAYRDMGFDPRHYPHAVAFYGTELTLPLHVALTAADVDQACSVLLGAMDRLSPVTI